MYVDTDGRESQNSKDASEKRVGEEENESLTFQWGGEGGLMNENQENGENEMLDFRGLEREMRTRK